MYVQIDEKIRKQLNDNIICIMMMGSHAHGLNNDLSDIDYLYIYNEPSRSILCEDNGWQFKSDGIDENYQSLETFIRNCIKSDSPADYEALMGGWTYTVGINYKMRQDIDYIFNKLKLNNSYSLIKAYLGYAKKDASVITQMLSTGSPVNNELNKRLSHLYRGILTAKSLLHNIEYSFTSKSKHTTEWQMAYALKNGLQFTTHEEISLFLADEIKLMDSLRDELNSRLNAHTITRRLNSDLMRDVSRRFYRQEFEEQAVSVIDNENLLIKIMESGATFQYK